MKTKRLIKRFEFVESDRPKITLGTDVRLNPNENLIQLDGGDDDVYPLDTDLYAKTWVTNPKSVRQWLGFECVVTNARNNLWQIVTGVNFRLSDGTDEYWWNGASWVVDVVNWNTESEVAANITSFPVTSKKIQVVLNPYTTDETKTPLIHAVKILYLSDIKHHEDYIYRTIVRQLRENIRPIADHPVEMLSATDTIDLSAAGYKPETPYNIVGIDAVFDHTADPDHATDLYQSFDEGTQILTLSSSVTAGNILWVQFLWEPEVAVTTGTDYDEVSKVPSLILNNIVFVNKGRIGQDDWVNNISDDTSVKLPGAEVRDIDVTLHAITDSAKDQTRLEDELNQYFTQNPIITSYGLDEDFRLWLVDTPSSQTVSNQANIHTGRLRFILVGALFWEREAIDTFTVKQFKLAGDMDVQIN